GTTYTSVFPATVAVKAILEPSGENCGSVSTPGVAVRRRAWPPLRETTHISLAYSNATRSRLTAGCRRSLVPWAAAAAEHNRTAIKASINCRSKFIIITVGYCLLLSVALLSRPQQAYCFVFLGAG